MKALATLFILFLLAACCRASDSSEEGPHLEVVSTSGNLEIDRPSAIAIEICNNATYDATYDANYDATYDAAYDETHDAGELTKEPDALGLEKSKYNASAIVAELSSQDDGINVLSGPQVIGTLSPGMNRSVRFSALAGSTPKGVYPLQLKLRFSRLAKVSSTGDESVPDVSFSYEEERLELPIEVDVVQGPKIKTEEIKGNVALGKESELEPVFSNRGDEIAVDLQMEIQALPPFVDVQNSRERLRIEPGGTTSTKLLIRADKNATPGYYPLPCSISYRIGEEGDMRSEELALLIYMQNDSFPGWLMMPAAGLLLLVGGFLGGRTLLGQKKRKTRNFRR